jgi:hypothetical protein
MAANVSPTIASAGGLASNVGERDHPEIIPRRCPALINDRESPHLSFLHLLHRLFQRRRWRA